MTEETGKLAHWRLKLLEFEIDVVHQPDIRQQAADALSRFATVVKDDTPLKNDLPVLTIFDDATSEDIPSVLMITDSKYGWPPKPVPAKETRKSTLGWENIGNTDGTRLQIYSSPTSSVVSCRQSGCRPSSYHRWIHYEPSKSCIL